MNPLSPERFMIDDTLMEKDYDYMHRIMPAAAFPLLELLEDVCDRLEYEGSFLYDECPDKTTLLKLTDHIFEKLSTGEKPDFKDFIHALLCDEILYRRLRYYRKKKMFED